MSETEFDPSGLTALVVDENSYQRSISIDLLRTMGFRRIFAASNTASAWDQLLATDPNIILVEWIKGATDGLDFVRRIRQSEEAPNRAVKIFMLTARGALTEVETARRAGVDGYLRKPISALALQQRVRLVVNKPQPFVVTASYVGPCRRRDRPGAKYTGPLRRLTDVQAAVAEETDHNDLKTELARARVAALEAAVLELTPGNPDGARAVFNAVQTLIEIGEQIGDASLCLGAREIARYVQAQGATDRLDPEAIRLHVAALYQLVSLPISVHQERTRVAESLKRMVDKKLRHTHSAA
jgi:CheY-like chemotaxis protein